MAFSPSSNSSGPLSTLKYLCDRAGVDFKFNVSPSIADPAAVSFATVFFKNGGKRLVRIVNESEVHFLEPEETVCLGLSSDLRIPSVEALNNGV